MYPGTEKKYFNIFRKMVNMFKMMFKRSHIISTGYHNWPLHNIRLREDWLSLMENILQLSLNLSIFFFMGWMSFLYRNMCQGLDYIFYSDDEESEKKEWRLLQNFDKKNNQIWIYFTFLSNFWELPTFEESNTEEWKHKEWKLTLLWSRICWIFMPDAGMYFFLKKWLWNWEFSSLPVPLRGTIHPWTDSEY